MVLFFVSQFYDRHKNCHSPSVFLKVDTQYFQNYRRTLEFFAGEFAHGPKAEIYSGKKIVECNFKFLTSSRHLAACMVL